MKFPSLLLAALLSSWAGLPAAGPTPLPVETFFAEPDMRSVQVSPDGHYIAFLTTLGTGKVGIALMDLTTGKVEALVAAKDENIQQYFWKGNDYIVYAGDLGGNESPAYRSIGLAKRKVVALSESYRERYAEDANQAQLIDTLRYDPFHILVAGNKAAGSRSFQYWYLDVRTGERRAADTSGDPFDAGGYVADNNGILRARTRYSGKKILFEVRPAPTALFTTAAEFPINDPRWEFLQFAADNETLYLISKQHSDTGTLHAYNVRTRELGPPLFHSPDGEIDNILTSWDRTKLYGVAYTTEKTHRWFCDDHRAALQAKIDNALPNTENIVVSAARDENLFVVAATSDREPGTYYVLDLAHGRMGPVGRVNHRVDPAQMRPMEPITFQARDGLTLHGYLTRPAGSAGHPVPLIINPHGGPYGPRDEWGFNGEVQFLANRGYAVLQVNYRGSGGYGLAFEAAGKREWGGRMQDDLTDAVKWAIAQGITDAGHVGIYGGSYGGYAALAGAAFTPDLYRCAVNYVGVSDLSIITSWGRGRFGRGSDLFAKEWIGDDAQYKRDHSPVNFVDRIRIPILNAYGFNDPRVDIDHWKRLEAKLRQAGKTYEIIIEENEGHGFKNEAARINFYRHLEAFLAKYLPAS